MSGEKQMHRGLLVHLPAGSSSLASPSSGGKDSVCSPLHLPGSQAPCIANSRAQRFDRLGLEDTWAEILQMNLPNHLPVSVFSLRNLSRQLTNLNVFAVRNSWVKTLWCATLEDKFIRTKKVREGVCVMIHAPKPAGRVLMFGVQQLQNLETSPWFLRNQWPDCVTAKSL